MKKAPLKSRLKAAWDCLRGHQVTFGITVSGVLIVSNRIPVSCHNSHFKRFGNTRGPASWVRVRVKAFAPSCLLPPEPKRKILPLP